MTCRSVEGLTAALFLLAAPLAAADPGPPSHEWSLANPEATAPSRVRDRPPVRSQPIQRIVTPMMAAGPIVDREVMGYLPYWEMDYDFPRWDLLTTVAWFGVEISASGDVVNWRGWPDNGDLVEEAHANGVRVVVTIVLFGKESIGELLLDPAHRQATIDTCLTAISMHNADGVNIDFETVPLSAKSAFTSFMTELKQAVAEIQPNGEEGHVTLAGPAVDWDGSYDYDQLLIHTDGIMVMAYDYHWPDGDPGPVSPLTSGDIWSKWNVSWTIEDYLLWGEPQNRHKLFLGLPLYGRRWPVANSSVPGTSLGKASTVRCSEARANAPPEGYIWDENSQTPYYHEEDDGLWQVWFDDQASFGMKVAAAVEADLGGIGLWALGYDGEDMAEWVEIEDQLTGTLPALPDPDPEPEPDTSPEVVGDAAPAEPDVSLPSEDREIGPEETIAPESSGPTVVAQTEASTRTVVTDGCTTSDAPPPAWGGVLAILILALNGRRARWSSGREA